MTIFSFTIVLRNTANNETVEITYDETHATDYRKAWKCATNQACFELGKHDPHWIIDRIESNV